MHRSAISWTRLGGSLAVTAALFGCGSTDEKHSSLATTTKDGGATDPSAPKDVLADLHAIPVPAGGQSFYTPVLTLAPGQDVTYCTYTTTTTESDLFVHSTRGTQSKMGHHTLLFYAETPSEARTEVCGGQSMETLRQMIGGGGGEGTATWTPPANVGTVVPSGSQLVLQSHWINTGVDDVRVQGMMITEPGEDGPNRIEAGTLTVIDLGFQVPAHASGSTQTDCVVDGDHHLLMSIGHEHEWGTHVRAEVTRANGTLERLFDRDFTPHDVFDPPINGYSVDSPLTFQKGDTIHLSCDWQNTTDLPLGFPREMCVFFGFTMDPGDARCINGGWMNPGSGGSDAASAVIPGPPCAAVGAPGNDVAVGKYCTKGGGECSGTASTICLADYTSGDFGDFCTKLCSADGDCGAGAACLGSGGTPKACMPTACVSAPNGTDGGTAAP